MCGLCPEFIDIIKAHDICIFVETYQKVMYMLLEIGQFVKGRLVGLLLYIKKS